MKFETKTINGEEVQLTVVLEKNELGPFLAKVGMEGVTFPGDPWCVTCYLDGNQYTIQATGTAAPGVEASDKCFLQTGSGFYTKLKQGAC